MGNVGVGSVRENAHDFYFQWREGYKRKFLLFYLTFSAQNQSLQFTWNITCSLLFGLMSSGPLVLVSFTVVEQ